MYLVIYVLSNTSMFIKLSNMSIKQSDLSIKLYGMSRIN